MRVTQQCNQVKAPDHDKEPSVDAVVEVDGLDRQFGRFTALDAISLKVPRGQVFGLVGENGAGKTTLIQHILGLLRPQRGRVLVFGLDPAAHPARVLGRTGVVAEDRDLPGWMRLGELLNYTSLFYPSWDRAYAEELRRSFGLDTASFVGSFSQGQLAKASLLVALAHRPELLVLDEPSSGLDPVVRRDILEAILCTVAEAGRTVLFSSHLLDEVERVADHVAMLKSGRLVFNASIETLKDSHHRLVVRARSGQKTVPDIQGIIVSHGGAPEWTLLCKGTLDRIMFGLQHCGMDVIETCPPTLDEVFVAYCASFQLRTDQRESV